MRRPAWAGPALRERRGRFDICPAFTTGAFLVPTDDLSVTDERQLEVHDHVVNGLAWSPDSARLASTGWDGTVRISS